MTPAVASDQNSLTWGLVKNTGTQRVREAKLQISHSHACVTSHHGRFMSCIELSDKISSISQSLVSLKF